MNNKSSLIAGVAIGFFLGALCCSLFSAASSFLIHNSSLSSEFRHQIAILDFTADMRDYDRMVEADSAACIAVRSDTAGLPSRYVEIFKQIAHQCDVLYNHDLRDHVPAAEAESDWQKLHELCGQILEDN